MVLAEKSITVDVVEVDPASPPEDVIDLNPYGTLPTLVDRDLVLYESRIIMEYLDERFPHPPLLPVDPVSRARSRLFMYRVERDWYSMIRFIESGTPENAEKARRRLRETLAVAAPIFEAKPFFMSDELTLVDCCVAPLLWRLPVLGVNLPAQAGAVEDYAERLFARPSFQESLTDAEREMRD